MFAVHEKYIVDEKGTKSAVVLPYAEWNKICEVLEEYEDICAYDKAKAQPSDPISFDDALKILKDAA
jgi:hypothetical protein